jgi:hypothetical protein
MAIFLLTLSLFLCAFVTHAFWCRVRRTQKLAMVSWAVITGMYFLILFMLALHHPYLWLALVFFVSLALFYICFYHSIIINSPSRIILEEIGHRREMTYAELLKIFDQHDFIGSRLGALIESRLVVFKDGILVLTDAGKKIAQVLNAYQRITKRERGG